MDFRTELSGPDLRFASSPASGFFTNPQAGLGTSQMSTVEEQLRQAASDMTKIGASFAVVGGLAVSARAEPRMTRDADLAIRSERPRG
jgi:hypothetical protein